MVVAWIVLGLGLLYFELHHLAFFALFAAIGSFAAAVTALVAPDAIVVQALVAVMVTVLGVVAVRPFASKAIQKNRRGGHVAHGVHGGIVGQTAFTLDEVGTVQQVGHVRLAGERWLAVSGSQQVIPPRTEVTVTALSGTTLVVWPTHELFDHPSGAVLPLLDSSQTAIADHVIAEIDAARLEAAHEEGRLDPEDGSST